MWEQIAANRRRSFFVVATMGVVLVATGLALGMTLTGNEGGAVLGGVAALIVWLVLWLVAVTQGDAILLKLSGAREIGKADHPQLVNVVEEMTIAALLPKPPRVFLIADRSPNAFATGRTPENAAVTVTTGLLTKLTRDELQGVVAHEIGHIKNRDIALMTTAGIMLGSIVVLSEFGARMLFMGGGRRSRGSSGGGGSPFVLAFSVLFMLLAPIMAQLLYLALSRRREYLADASGAMFTRYPEGLASALETISGAAVPMRETSRVTAPMYIAPPRAASRTTSSLLFATHPPTHERVRILRTMAGGCDFRAYDAAYRQVKGGGVVGKITLAETKSVPVRAASAEGAMPATVAAVERHRAAGDALLRADGYKWIECPCGATMKVPPGAVSRLSNCPRCGQAV